jgi:hypothetical protein
MWMKFYYKTVSHEMALIVLLVLIGGAISSSYPLPAARLGVSVHLHRELVMLCKVRSWLLLKP